MGIMQQHLVLMVMVMCLGLLLKQLVMKMVMVINMLNEQYL
jgi:hypothetical protein